MNTSQKTAVIELVRFKLIAGVTQEDYVAACAKTDAFVQAQPGFRARALSLAEDGTWTDYVTWADMDSAQAAAKAFPENEYAQAIMGMIDGSTLQMWHETKLWSSAA
jgi:antibiotic biosynthesis monooxygenase (ABM) superfamily enzyme